MKESEIVYETPNGKAWVHATRAGYVVYRAGLTHSTSDSVYPKTDDGLSIAKARADYLERGAR